MNERVTRFALGANLGFVRCYCRQCKSDTLHRAQLCVHCGASAIVQQRVKSKWQYKDGLQIRRRQA